MTGVSLPAATKTAWRLPPCLLFDLDGTLLDSEPGISFSIHAACQTAGLPSPRQDLRAFLGPPVRTILGRLFENAEPALLDKLEAAFRASYDTEGWQKTSCFPGAHEVLDALQSAGHRLFVVSNKPRQISLRILSHLRIRAFFEQIYTRDSRSPPYSNKEEIIRELLQEQRVSPSDCLMVGDTMEDVSASVANRIDTALMEYGYGQELSALPVRLRLNKLEDFLSYMQPETTD
jgi:phosphoglycolate phosphatase